MKILNQIITLSLLGGLSVTATTFAKASSIKGGYSSDHCIPQYTFLSETKEEIADYLGVDTEDIKSIDEDYSKRITISGCRNFSQDTLNKYYNNTYEVNLKREKEAKEKYGNLSIGGVYCSDLFGKRTIDLTCGTVAITTLVDFYGNQKGEYKVDSPEETFCKIVDACYDADMTVIDVKGTKMDNMLTTAFKAYGSKRSGKNDWFDCRATTRDYINEGKPVILSTNDHYVVAYGVTTYTVTYTETYHYGFLGLKKGKREAKKDIEAFIICEGAEEKYDSIILSKYITNVTNLSIITYAKDPK